MWPHCLVYRLQGQNYFLLLCPARVTWAFSKTHRDESFKNKPSSVCRADIYWWRWLSPLLPPHHPLSEWPPFTQGEPPFPRKRTPAGKGFVLQGPWWAPSGGWRPSRAGPLSHGQLLRSRRVSEGKTWTWSDPTKQSPCWVHPQATAPIPLTPTFSCSSLLFSIFIFIILFLFFGPVFPSRPIHFPEQNNPPPSSTTSTPCPLTESPNSPYSSQEDESSFMFIAPFVCVYVCLCNWE